MATCSAGLPEPLASQSLSAVPKGFISALHHEAVSSSPPWLSSKVGLNLPSPQTWLTQGVMCSMLLLQTCRKCKTVMLWPYAAQSLLTRTYSALKTSLSDLCQPQASLLPVPDSALSFSFCLTCCPLQKSYLPCDRDILL